MINFTNHYETIFEDNDIVVVSKAHGLHVIQDRACAETNVLHNLLKDKYGKIFTVHRLDAGTGGLIVFAKTAYSHKQLSIQFDTREVYKEYIAITNGTVINQTLMLPIAKGSHGKFKINFKSGKQAITSFITADTKNNHSLLKCAIYTGRTHQIRVHLRALKAPLYQDWLYNTKIDDKRLTLFSHRLAFTHPVTKDFVDFTAPMSDFMNDIMLKLELSIKNV